MITQRQQAYVQRDLERFFKHSLTAFVPPRSTSRGSMSVMVYSMRERSLMTSNWHVQTAQHVGLALKHRSTISTAAGLKIGHSGRLLTLNALAL